MPTYSRLKEGAAFGSIRQTLRQDELYLSAGDDQLRHESDGPSIGIIFCKGKNEVVVEYALRDSTKPMGVAEYRLSAALPDPLQAELPTEAEFPREFPLMALVKLRIEVEREIRSLVANQTEAERHWLSDQR
ncbi:DUF1016 domain-containing protein [Rhizobium sp. P32RR-XVIII]|nr:DUF1016 domain-containing protein [Rhizobium sp. P32RR-XVIII]